MIRVNQIYQLTVCDMEKCPPFLTGIYHTTWAFSIATCQIVELLLHYRRVQHDGSMFSPESCSLQPKFSSTCRGERGLWLLRREGYFQFIGPGAGLPMKPCSGAASHYIRKNVGPRNHPRLRYWSLLYGKSMVPMGAPCWINVYPSS